MSHGDEAVKLPDGFVAVAKSEQAGHARCWSSSRGSGGSSYGGDAWQQRRAAASGGENAAALGAAVLPGAAGACTSNGAVLRLHCHAGCRAPSWR